MKITKPSK